ncbi:MAG: hypothetical protein Q8P93_02640 [bacterium]|nr:hypothetical protein [bacterium]
MAGRRNIIQDIIKTRGADHRSRPPEAVDPSREKVLRGRGSSSRTWAIRIFILAIIVVIGLWATSAFGRVEVRIVPHNRIVSVDGNYNAREVPPVTLTDVGDYDIIQLSQTAQVPVVASGQEFVERKARGIITVFNDHSAKNERLIAHTRFESPDGDIYRIEGAISVSGKTDEAPGKLEVEVVADDFGDAYNLEGDVRFTVPGLAGDDRFEDVYATLKSPITGGYSGVQKSASEKDIENAERAVREQASANLASRLAESVAADYVLFDDAVVVTFSRTPGDASGGVGDEYIVEGTATAYGIVFDRALLSALIARRGLTEYNEQPILIENLDTAEFDFLNKQDFIPGQTDQIVFKISGPLRFVWQYDEEKLLSELVGLKKSEFQKIFLSYPSVANAESNFFPSWKRSFPEDPAEIRVVRILDEPTR